MKLQTDRYVNVLILMFGKEKVKNHSDMFIKIYARFHEVFDHRMASEKSPWETKDFEIWKTALCLASSCGDYCPKECGRLHADLFSHDGCPYSESRTTDEKGEMKTYKTNLANALKASSREPDFPHSKS